MWPARTQLYDSDDNLAGTVGENCFRVDDSEAFRCDGTMKIDAYDGIIGCSGIYPDDATGELYLIVGGSGVSAGARGPVTSAFDKSTGYSVRIITFEQAVCEQTRNNPAWTRNMRTFK
jgi:hypothetical protein